LRRSSAGTAATLIPHGAMLHSVVALPLREGNGQEVSTMAIDMTAQLAPMIWGMLVLMVVASVSLLAAHNHN